MTRIRDYLTVAEAVQLADDLLYHVKQHGKRNIAYYQGRPSALSAIRAPIHPLSAPASAAPAICYHPATLIVSVPATGQDNPILVPYVHCPFAELALSPLAANPDRARLRRPPPGAGQRHPLILAGRI